MKRPDIDMIRKIKKHGSLSEKHIKELLDLPYFYMSHKLMDEFDFSTEGDLPERTILEEREDQRALVRHFASNAEFVYDELVLSAKNKIQLEHDHRYEVATVNYWGHLKRVREVYALHLVIDYPSTGEILSWEGCIDFIETTDEDGNPMNKVSPRMAPHYEKFMREKYQALFDQGRIAKKANFDYFMKGLCQQAAGYWLFIARLMAYLKYGDRHAVEVVPEKPKKVSPALSRDRPWVSATGPRVLLLDRMPTTQSQGTGTHASPKPHRRRGHWKTLRHPRFRHHPQYGGKIYVKPSFVGPRQATYEGNIYRLVEPTLDNFV